MPRVTKLQRSWGAIAFDDDLILDIISRTNYTEKQVTIFYNFLMTHIRNVLRQDEVMALRIPHLGTFVFNVAHAKHYLNSMDKLAKKSPLNNSQRSRYKRFKQRIELFDEYYEAVKARDFVFTPHKQVNFINRLTYRRGRSLEQLEIDQNTQKYAKKF